MKAEDVATALTKRWPEDRHLHIAEATFDPWRQGTKIDVAIVACWKSLKWEIDAVEIKVSLSDFKREIERYYWTVDGVDLGGNPRRFYDRRQADASRYGIERYDDDGQFIGYGTDLDRKITRHAEPCTHKSLPWREVAHRFWIACPAELAAKIGPLLPADEGWGLIAVDGRGCVVKVKPIKNQEPRTLEWSEQIGLLRCAMDASSNVRARSFDKGAEAGYRVAQLDLMPDTEVVPIETHHPRGLTGWNGRPL